TVNPLPAPPAAIRAHSDATAPRTHLTAPQSTASHPASTTTQLSATPPTAHSAIASSTSPTHAAASFQLAYTRSTAFSQPTYAHTAALSHPAYTRGVAISQPATVHQLSAARLRGSFASSAVARHHGVTETGVSSVAASSHRGSVSAAYSQPPYTRGTASLPAYTRSTALSQPSSGHAHLPARGAQPARVAAPGSFPAGQRTRETLSGRTRDGLAGRTREVAVGRIHEGVVGQAVDSEMDDGRGDGSRPMGRAVVPEVSTAGEAPEETLRIAARLIGADPAQVRTDPAVNIRAGAALLASYQREPSQDPNAWYDAVARYSGSDDPIAARAFADEVFEVMRSGAARRTDEGAYVRLAPTEGLRHPTPMRMASRTECPAELGCEWMPAAYKRFGKKDYGNHDRMRGSRRIDYIVIHDTEGTYGGVASMVHDPQYVSWHYTIRSRDGHVAQHVLTRDIAWHAGNWDVNSRSIGIEHEGYLAKGTWYTEALYRSSARLVRYLAGRFDIPLDRAHILGHDNVPGTTPKMVSGMHEDPGPYWDWAHYFELLGAPFEPAGKGSSVIIRPDFDQNRPTLTGCAKRKKPCPPRGSSTIWLRKAPRDNAVLVDDIGKTLGRNSTYSVYDHSARASTGQRYALAGTSGDWTAIWYLGQKAWFRNPPDRPTAIPATGPLVVPRHDKVKVYGRAYPERAAYRRTGVKYQPQVPLQYRLRTGQRYSLGLTIPSSYQSAKTFNPARHVTVHGKLRYYQIQLGHRVMFVKTNDVRVLR
ncbi:N-acetylmuramoyl-L-alanine amidase, partial [Nonomuraea sediminis]|uniref:N-acetylmuramoyl-L-alanine amidase n=1 Tax=Nonomuraea sediminis TaxID=2835864 RepID=UPI0027E06890